MFNIMQEIINKVADKLVLCESEGGWIEMGGKGSGNWGHRGRKGKRGGSAPSKGSVGIQYISREAKQTIRRKLRQQRQYGQDMGSEASAYIESDGKVIAQSWGQADPLATGPKTTVPLEEAKGAYIITHNHLSNASFSDGDVATFLRSDAQHIFVITHNGTVYRMSKTPETDASQFKRGIIKYKIDQAVGKTESPAQRIKAELRAQKQVLPEVTKKIGLDYSKEPDSFMKD